ncbi:MAG: hypothetical protein IT446_08045 [Phycisphaerales bacterium]|jgi:hypothetical protein|nr:hypothetical protein [Phycisphaerales bacterium]
MIAPAEHPDPRPQGSDIQLQEQEDALVFHVAARRPDKAALNKALRQAALAALWLWFGSVVILAGIGGALIWSHRDLLPAWGLGLFALFILLLFGAYWWFLYLFRVDRLQRFYGQSTLLAVRPQRLRIKATGLMGDQEHDLTRTQIQDIKLIRAATPDSATEPQMTDWVGIMLRDGRTLQVLGGREIPELRWVAQTIRQQMGFEPAGAV